MIFLVGFELGFAVEEHGLILAALCLHSDDNDARGEATRARRTE